MNLWVNYSTFVGEQIEKRSVDGWSGHNWNSANIEKGNSITYGQMEISEKNRSGQISCNNPI